MYQAFDPDRDPDVDGYLSPCNLSKKTTSTSVESPNSPCKWESYLNVKVSSPVLTIEG